MAFRCDALGCGSAAEYPCDLDYSVVDAGIEERGIGVGDVVVAVLDADGLAAGAEVFEADAGVGGEVEVAGVNDWDGGAWNTCSRREFQ
jgi:hypothetical protein